MIKVKVEVNCDVCISQRNCEKWNVSDRMVRNYCAHGRIPGTFLTGKTWNVPVDAVKSERELT